MNCPHKSLLFILFSIFFGILLHAFMPDSLQAKQPAPGENPKQEQINKENAGKTFRVQFFSLKSGHSIAPATMFLYDRGALEIKVEHEALTTSRASYTAAGYFFQADWEFIVKKVKPYHYICHFSGLYLFDTYITGLLTMKEFIEDARLTQEILFIFFASVSDK